ncbi:MAG TPA: HAMP domain-containing protein, partial [Desulfobacterales bacterium]|nr:HAMP domain-containing protein [Desulfobacterales bacterium]
MTIKKKLLFLSLGLIALLSVTGMLQFQSIVNVGSQWTNYKESALSRQVYLAEIESEFGYGGFIHNFKNHVLRGTQKYADRVTQNKERMYKAFEAYNKLDLSSEERSALSAAQAVADQYVKAIATSVSMHKDGKNPMEIDKAVKINDSPAFKAFEVLKKHVQTLEKDAGDSLNNTIKKLKVLMMFAAMSMLAFFILFFLVLLKVGKRLSIIKDATIEMGKGNFAAPIKIGGNDEISSIANALGAMSGKLQDVIHQISKQAKALTNSSQSLSDISTDLSEGTRDASS